MGVFSWVELRRGSYRFGWNTGCGAISDTDADSFVAARALPLVFQYDVHGSKQSRPGLRSTRGAGTISSPLIIRYWYAATLTHPSAISPSKMELGELPTPCSARRVPNPREASTTLGISSYSKGQWSAAVLRQSRQSCPQR